MKANPMSSSTKNPRKRKAVIDDNGEPVTLGKKKALGPRPVKKLKKAPTKSATQKAATTTAPEDGTSGKPFHTTGPKTAGIC